MIEQINLALVSENGDLITIKKTRPTQIEIKLEEFTADIFSQICFHNNSIEDTEIKLAEKFHFALHLQNYLKEMANDE